MVTKTASEAEIVTVPQSETAGQVSTATRAVTFFGAVTRAGRNAMAGVIEVDRALIGYAREAVAGYIDLGKETLRANKFKDVVDLHVARAHARVEANAANVREIVDLTRVKLQETYAPIKEAYQANRAPKAL